MSDLAWLIEEIQAVTMPDAPTNVEWADGLQVAPDAFSAEFFEGLRRLRELRALAAERNIRLEDKGGRA